MYTHSTHNVTKVVGWGVVG